MSEWARGFGEYVVIIAGGVGVALIAALIVLALSRITFPTIRLLWRRASPLGRFFGALLFLICSINATTKAPTRSAPKRVAVSSATTSSQSQPTRIEKWFRRGAWRDDHYLKFDTDWVFPHGTNHYSGIWIYSWGKLAAPRTRQSFAALGTELALFPEESEVTWERTTSNTYRVAWQNGFPDRRSRENAMSASFELFRNGDIAITTNNVTRYIERELPFDCAGRGQDTAWVAANYPNDVEAIAEAGGYAAWVDEKVGVGLENGLYRFTATFPTTPLEVIELFVGPYTVAVTNAGDYVFLLEKGRDYSFGTRPFIADVTYAAVDDLGDKQESKVTNRASHMYVQTWTEVVGFLSMTKPSENTEGSCSWLPKLRGSPDDPEWSPGSLPQTFTAELTDFAYNTSVAYEWKAPKGNLAIISPSMKETEVCWLSATTDIELSVTAKFGEHSLTSTFATYIIEETEHATLTLAMPRALIKATQEGDLDGNGDFVFAFSSPYPTNGIIKLTCDTGGHVDIDGLEDGATYEWEVSSFSNIVARLIPKSTSDAMNDVQFHATFVPEEGDSLEADASLTVVEADELSLMADTPRGVALLCGKPFVAKIGIKPKEATHLVSARWQTRQLQRSGSYNNWDDCYFFHTSEPDAILTPTAGGIYQLRATIFDGVGGEATRVYKWESSEDVNIGLCQKGDYKSIGVASEQWQLDLLNCARGFLGKTGYGYNDDCPGQYGFATVPAGSWKCNIFVAYRACQLGFNVPAMHWDIPFGILPPLANEWAGSKRIEGWTHAQGCPQPGWIIAHPNAFGSGHVGITDFDGAGVAAGSKFVNRRFKNWQDGTSTYRRKE